MSYPVIIVDYDPDWSAQYAAEADRIREVLGDRVVAVEHIGSTAVPGLGAKPIIDLVVGLRDLADAQDCIAPLERLGYEYVPQHEARMPERRYFHKGPPRGRTHHLHMVEVTSGFWKRHLLFRDYLRAHPGVAREYEALKRELAGRHGADREAYTDAKTAFIERVVDRARAAQGGV
ncbi:MAG: GrpB family protein [Anaerolineae bacterium]